MAAARIRLNVNIRQWEAESMARDYLPRDAVEQLRRNRERPEVRALPEEYRDRAGVSRTILDGVTRTADLELQPAGVASWFQRVQLRIRSWKAGKEIVGDLRARAEERDQANAERARAAAKIGALIDVFTRQRELALECARLREDYAKKIEALCLPAPTHQEAIGALDAVIDYHVTLITDESTGR